MTGAARKPAGPTAKEGRRGTRRAAPPAPPASRDPLGDGLVAAGLAPNGYVLDLNGTLTAPASFLVEPPWNLPSRLFRFPVETNAPSGGGPRRLGLMHPLLGPHPFVRHVEAVMGFPIPAGGAPNDAGYTTSRIGEWWHAVDLISGHWRELLATRQFTTGDSIARAVAYGLHHKTPGFGLQDAHKVMRELGTRPPNDRAGLVRRLLRPSIIKASKETGPERWPVNYGRDLQGADLPWALIVGLEDGWMSWQRGGFIGWTEIGRDAYARPEGPAPRGKPMQLGLF